jgi:hypothetical protein
MPDCLAGDAVLIAPVSTRNSLLTGNFTGNFAKTAASGRSETSSNGVIAGLPTRIPYSKKQGIIFAEQGIWAGEQEI